jgi:hypothetical protein
MSFELVRHETVKIVKKSSYTVIERVILSVAGFEKVAKTLEKQTMLRG